ncbi:MAG: hypothetical protein H8E55_34070 [Pelagibacterales bacterium]|nr:hypothetical protein [Pelagibacterales bacterium]
MVSYTSGVVTKPRDWDHICVRNSSSLLEVFVNGATGTAATSGSLPIGVTSNNADITIGSTNSTRTDGGNNQHISEIRFYDYAINTIALNSLSNHNYLSGSLYQTNVAGNVFYKNGQIVVSSPMPKYNSGSGVFGNTFDGSYKGTHTIYENEVLIRVPKDVFNVSMNPSSTYQLSTTGDNCTTNQTEVLPGEFRKNLFVSGTLVPYITTIGLYNPKGQMLAAAKLAQPIQKNDDVDMNFIIRWDY